jgi:hypothetical protein
MASRPAAPGAGLAEEPAGMLAVMAALRPGRAAVREQEKYAVRAGTSIEALLAWDGARRRWAASATASFRLLGRAPISPAGCAFAARRCALRYLMSLGCESQPRLRQSLGGSGSRCTYPSTLRAGVARELATSASRAALACSLRKRSSRASGRACRPGEPRTDAVVRGRVSARATRGSDGPPSAPPQRAARCHQP